LTPGELRFPVVYSAGTLIAYGPSPDFGVAYVGGPREVEFTGVELGQAPLHRILTLSLVGLPLPEGHTLYGSLPLFYGMRYSGCRLRYRAGAHGRRLLGHGPLEILELSPATSSARWPYAGYPELLPYVPLAEVARQPISSRDFEEQYTWQGIPGLGHNSLAAVVPALSSIGVSMWGRTGDDEQVQLVFLFDPGTYEVTASNQCT